MKRDTDMEIDRAWVGPAAVGAARPGREKSSARWPGKASQRLAHAGPRQQGMKGQSITSSSPSSERRGSAAAGSTREPGWLVLRAVLLFQAPVAGVVQGQRGGRDDEDACRRSSQDPQTGKRLARLAIGRASESGTGAST